MNRSGYLAHRLGALGVLSLALALGMVACGSDPTPTPLPTATPVPQATATPTPSQPAWELEWEETLAAAQDEGELNYILGAGASRSMGSVYEEFNRLFDIEVITSVGRGADHVDRVFAEQAAGRYTVDMGALGLTQINQRLVPAGALEPIEPLLFHPDVVDKSNWFQGRFWWGDAEQKHAFLYAGRVQAPDGGLIWNTDSLGEDFGASLETIWDLLDDPRLKGTGAGLPPRAQVGNSYISLVQNPDIGEEFVERFFTELDFDFVEDPGVAVDSILQGTYAWGMFLGGTRRDLVRLADQGAPISGLDLEGRTLGGTLEITSGTSLEHVLVFKQAPNPNAVKLFVNWFFSKEGQTFYHENVPDPRPTLRIDGVPDGNTLEIQRRQPGVEYLMNAFDPVMIAQQGDVLAWAENAYSRLVLGQ